MTARPLISLGLSVLVLGGLTVGCTAQGDRLAAFGGRSAPAADAAGQARRATKALAHNDSAAAIGFAEAAVAASPRDPAYRALLGKSYLQAGRFASARDAFGDALQLQPDNGRAALDLALATIATGDWQGARRVLAAHDDRIAPADLGLAMALSGDPAGAVALLTQAARTPGADAKTRQNLALALALGGQWPMARAVAAADVSPADLDARMQQWALFAQPRTASDQVAALLGVSPVEDHGQPVALALTAPAPVAAPVAVAEVAPTAPRTVTAAPTETTAPVLAVSRIAFAPRHEVVQPLPGATLSATRASIATAAFAAREDRQGSWVVQLGAYRDAAVARDAWARISRRHAVFAQHRPQGAAFRAQSGAYYRLSVGGFARSDADALCHRYRAQGGECFVRRVAGDQIAHWARPNAQVI